MIWGQLLESPPRLFLWPHRGANAAVPLNVSPLLMEIRHALMCCNRGAQTSANVFCTLYGSTGEHTAELRLDNHPSNFERGRRDQFEVKGRDVKDVERVRIGHDNTGAAL